LNSYTTLIAYHSIPDIIEALKNDEVQGALLDTYIAGEFQDQLRNYKLQEILEHVFVYGVVLARDASVLEDRMRVFIEQKQSSIYNTISKVIKPLKVGSTSSTSRFNHQISKQTHNYFDYLVPRITIATLNSSNCTKLKA